ncbi:HD family hydrolase [Magnetospirillum sp. UT-4]|uniref:HD domain-containing protein n=1 Tax=Magnetospirillum sp. UT-4 TaxID=2681467 RepID=UPI00137E3E90|nr:HD domain-containing protein [Magnetospirillum sp. UT-4]CAA7624391.1 Predicted metal-dependent phosphohydrolase [Magnetospirillum sp. UT-4]
MTDHRLSRQLAFVLELDKLKTVLRQTLLTDSSRRENDAEHSWHVAAMAVLLAEYAPEGADPWRAARMLLFHDVVEIDAGDTFIHDEAGNATKAAREAAAAGRLYGLLPPDQAAEFEALWREFEARDTATARFADALDRLQPILNNVATGGATWRSNGVTADQVARLVARIRAGAPALGDHAEALVADAVRRGYLAPAR